MLTLATLIVLALAMNNTCSLAGSLDPVAPLANWTDDGRLLGCKIKCIPIAGGCSNFLPAPMTAPAAILSQGKEEHGDSSLQWLCELFAQWHGQFCPSCIRKPFLVPKEKGVIRGSLDVIDVQKGLKCALHLDSAGSKIVWTHKAVVPGLLGFMMVFECSRSTTFEMGVAV